MDLAGTPASGMISLRYLPDPNISFAWAFINVLQEPHGSVLSSRLEQCTNPFSEFSVWPMMSTAAIESGMLRFVVGMALAYVNVCRCHCIPAICKVSGWMLPSSSQGVWAKNSMQQYLKQIDHHFKHHHPLNQVKMEEGLFDREVHRPKLDSKYASASSSIISTLNKTIPSLSGVHLLLPGPEQPAQRKDRRPGCGLASSRKPMQHHARCLPALVVHCVFLAVGIGVTLALGEWFRVDNRRTDRVQGG